jgi:hypothetical protein
MSSIIVLYGQSLFDIAVQEYGSIEAVFQLADDNDIYDITAELSPGTELIIDKNMIIDTNVVNYYKNNNITAASELRTEELQGVGYWQIGVDFIIS